MASTGDPELTIGPGGSPKVVNGYTEPTVEEEAGLYRCADGCTTVAATRTHGALTLTTWAQCTTPQNVELALYHGGDHGWPVGDATTPSGEQVTWDFFAGRPVATPAVRPSGGGRYAPPAMGDETPGGELIGGAREIETLARLVQLTQPVRLGGEAWQTYYSYGEGRLRRLHYGVDVLGGGPAVHYPSGYRVFDGIERPDPAPRLRPQPRRDARPRGRDGLDRCHPRLVRLTQEALPRWT